MKPPADHIAVHFPMPHRTRTDSSYVWRRARPSRCMAFMTLVFFSYPDDSGEHHVAGRWLATFKKTARLNFMATMAAMFGVRYLSSQDHRATRLRQIDVETFKTPSADDAGLWLSVLMTMVGQLPVMSLKELVLANPELWAADFARVRAIPGADSLVEDLARLISGNYDALSWERSPSTREPSRIRNVNDRTIRALRPGDAMLLSPASRTVSLAELLKRGRAAALRCSDDRRLYSAEVVEFPGPENFCVVIHRKS